MSIIERIQEIVTTKDKIIGGLESQLAEKDRIVKRSGETIELQKRQIMDVQEHLETETNNAEKWKTSYHESQKKLKLSNDELELSETKVRRISEENVKLKKATEDAAKTESTLKKKISKLENQLTSKSDEISELTNFIATLEGQLPPKKNR